VDLVALVRLLDVGAFVVVAVVFVVRRIRRRHQRPGRHERPDHHG
jgi:hypothetical protein